MAPPARALTRAAASLAIASGSGAKKKQPKKKPKGDREAPPAEKGTSKSIILLADGCRRQGMKVIIEPIEKEDGWRAKDRLQLGALLLAPINPRPPHAAAVSDDVAPRWGTTAISPAMCRSAAS